MLTNKASQRLAADDIPTVLEPVLRQRIPGATGATIADWRKAEAGFSADTFLFDVTGIDGPESRTGYVFRRPPEVALFPDYDLRRQYLTMQRLSDTSIKVPTMCWLDADPEVLGSPYYVMDRIEGGRSPSDVPAYHAAGMYFDADEKARETMWWGCVDTIAEVHQLDPAALRLDFLQYNTFGAGPVEQAVNYLEAAARWATAQVPPGIQRGLDWLKAHLYTPEHTTLCWGDSRLSNTLYGPDFSVIGVLDWEFAYLGDHEADLAWLLFIDWLSSEFQGNPRLPGTPDRTQVIERYERLTGFTVKRLQFNEVLAAVLLAVPLIRLSSHMEIEGITDLSAMCSERISQLLT